MQRVMARDGHTGQPLSGAAASHGAPLLGAVCAQVEGRIEALRNPHRPDTLVWLAWVAARLGGWSG